MRAFPLSTKLSQELLQCAQPPIVEHYQTPTRAWNAFAWRTELALGISFCNVKPTPWSRPETECHRSRGLRQHLS